MRVSSKLSLALGLPVLLLVASLGYHVLTLRESVETSFELSELSDRVFLSSSTQLSLLNQLDENAEKYWITRDFGYLERFQQLNEAFNQSVEKLGALDLTAAEQEQLGDLEIAWSDFSPVAGWLESVPPQEAAELASDSLALLRDQIAVLRWQVRRMGDMSQRVMTDRLELSAARAVRGERVALGATVSALLISLLISVAMIRSISGSLRRLKHGTRAVAGGDFEHRLPLESGDEFAELARDFNVMTRRLGELDRTKKHFLSTVSHDLKTPLASMQETTRILLDEVPGPVTREQRHLLDLSHQSGKRLASMIADLLDLSSMEAGAFSLQREVYDIREIVRQSVEQMEPLASERRVRLTMALPERPLKVNGDGARLTQVLVNLLSNAIKFSPADEEVQVSAHRFAGAETSNGDNGRVGVAPPFTDSAVICVSDRGPGVPEAERELIFHRFVQTEAGRSVRGRGVGLGLAICREIVSAHGGRIWVEDGTEVGSRFVLILPGALPNPIPLELVAEPIPAHT